MANTPSIERLRELFNYDPATGLLTWAVTRSIKCKAGDVAGYIRKDNYRMLRADYKRLLASRVAWAMYYGRWPQHEIGHRDGDRSNDAINNLIDAPRSVHHLNITLPERGRDLPVLGVSNTKHRRRFVAKCSGKHLGYFDSTEEASAAYQKHKKALPEWYRPD